ncbi:CRISPR-associated endonuclease Cas1 [Oryzibacter oryziterrae]|uniref:CRISPR-associated endonuclease Cas1 n=1 Tax=Oryzibacter oryziterrae TaxID=2766474 RepID=UPI001F010F9D|nr:CRISPR-associated endonuclease Cas1 [Oryzibacter oryziterrae]
MENSIFDRLATLDALHLGWTKVLANSGGPGGDGVSVHEFGMRAEESLQRLAQDLANGHYKPGPVRRTSIPKRSGGTRPLAIPCVRDRVVQSALHQLLEPVLEPTFSDDSFAYRPGRGVADAVRRVQDLHRQGFRHVIDADIRRFFENVPHIKMIERLQDAAPDPRIARLVALWLAQESDGRGLAQGSPISPILSNLYLDYMDDKLSRRGARLVRFADDFVVLCRSAAIASGTLAGLRKILSELGLELNVEKTRLIDFNRGFQFLGKLFVKSLVLPGSDDELTLLDLPVEGEQKAGRQVVLPDDYEDPEATAPQDKVTFSQPSSDQLSIERGDSLPPESWLPDTPAGREVHSLAPVLRPVYLLSPGRRLGVRGEAFAVFEDERIVVLLVPRRIGRIEIGPDADVDADAIRHALAWNVELAFVTSSGKTLGSLASPPRHAAWHLAQSAARLDLKRRLHFACAFADARMRNQRALLHRLNRRRKDVTVGETATKIGRIALKLKLAATEDAARGVEGEATAIFWPALGRTMDNGFSLSKRERHPPATPADMLLSMAAATLTRDIEALILRHGLHPGISFLHAPRDYECPLAWDFIEPFRAPLVEGLVVYLVNNRVITDDHVGLNPEGHWSISPDGRARFIRAYEAWLARPIKNRRTGGESVWRGLIEDDILAFRDALTTGAAFDPYVMDY